MSSTKRALAVVVALMLNTALLLQGTALAASPQGQERLQAIQQDFKKARTLKVTKGRSVTVYAVKGKWCKVKVWQYQGFMCSKSP